MREGTVQEMRKNQREEFELHGSCAGQPEEMLREKVLSEDLFTGFEQHLRHEGRKEVTIQKYLRDVRAFAVWLEGRPASRENAQKWREALLEDGYAPVTINSMLTALNVFFAIWAGRSAG